MWYAASVFFEGVSPEVTEENRVWQEVIYVIDADDEEGAAKMAETIAKSHEVGYKTIAGTHLFWRFAMIERVFEMVPPRVDAPESGTEVFARFMSANVAKTLLTDEL